MLKSNGPEKIDAKESVLFPLGKNQKTAKVSSREYLNKILIGSSRFLFVVLLIFEMLNILGVLHLLVNFHWIALFITTGSAWILLEVVFLFSWESPSQTALKAFVLTAAVVGIYADTLGQVYYLFDRIIWYDQVLHFFAGGVLCGIIIFLFIRNLNHRGVVKLKTLGIAFFAWIATIFIGLIYEFGEFILDSITGSNSLVSFDDTIDDLFLDALGSFLVVVILVIYFYYVSHRSSAPNKNPASENPNT